MVKVDDPAWQKVIDQCYAHGQGHIFRFWDELSYSEKKQFIEQLARIDWPQMENLIEKALHPEKHKIPELEPAPVISLQEREQRDAQVRPLGEHALQKGKVAICLVAGGQGSRLGFDGPKGCFPITPVKNKSLFQLHAEKIKAVSLKFKTTLPWYIMTSRSNHQQTVEFFQQHNYWGLGKENVYFFTQEMIPAVDLSGKFLLETKNKIFESPNGHGGFIKALYQSGAIDDMYRRGIEYIFYFQVDNVLVNMADPVFIGYHIQEKAQMSNKVVRKQRPEERVGVICKINGRTGVVEYSDLDEEHQNARGADGRLKFWAGSIAIHVIDVKFVESEIKNGFKLPFHIAQKSIPHLDENGQLVKPADKNGFKFETFIFDALLDAEQVCTIEVDRSKEFSAVKNREGFESPQTAREDLLKTYARWLQSAGVQVSLNGKGVPEVPLEISPLFALNEEELIRQKDRLPQKVEGPLYLE